MEVKEILELVQAVSNSDLTGFQYEENGVRLSFKKEKKAVSYVQQEVAAPMAAVVQPVTNRDSISVEQISVVNAENTGNMVTSPLVGTFYAAPAEDTEAFVKVGDTVKKGQVLAIVEAMKLMNEIESEFDGTVAEILVENAQMVEYGQPLFRIV